MLGKGKGSPKIGRQDREADKGDIFTYAERRRVVPSSEGPRHTGDVRVPLEEKNTEQAIN